MTDFEKWTLLTGTISAILSAAIAVLAIWGDWVRHILTPPSLRLRLRNAKGEMAPQRKTKARYYHLEVSNLRRWAPARNVVVNVVQIDRPVPELGWKRDYETGPIPLNWQYSSHYAGLPDVGRDRYCDLGFIEEGHPFVISTQFSPDHFNGVLREGERMRVHLVAVGDNGKSNNVVLQLEWDGQWHDGSEEMAKHLSVTVVNPSE